jgi:predicted NBD/HSP70 family sugar kinase
VKGGKIEYYGIDIGGTNLRIAKINKKNGELGVRGAIYYLCNY